MINKKYNYKGGMTYLEIIVVLSIFAVLSAVTLFNYGDFQDRVEIKSLTSDIALRVVTAQKSSLSGSIPARTISTLNWKPSFGIYFSTTNVMDASGGDSKDFIYFTDLDQSNKYTYSVGGCTAFTDECLDKINITKSNYISELKIFCKVSPPVTTSNLNITFSRPNSGATINAASTCSLGSSDIDYAQITVSSTRGATALIKIFPAGRIQIN